MNWDIPMIRGMKPYWTTGCRDDHHMVNKTVEHKIVEKCEIG